LQYFLVLQQVGFYTTGFYTGCMISTACGIAIGLLLVLKYCNT